MTGTDFLKELDAILQASDTPVENATIEGGCWSGFVNGQRCSVTASAGYTDERWHSRPTGKWTLTAYVADRRGRPFTTRKAGDKPNIAGVARYILEASQEVVKAAEAARLAKEARKQSLLSDHRFRIERSAGDDILLAIQLRQEQLLEVVEAIQRVLDK